MIPQQAQDVIQAHKTANEHERQRWDKYHDWYLAETDRTQNWVDEYNLPMGDDSLSLETNYPYAWVDTMIASICPTNPMITISARNPEMRDQAKMRELLANDTMRWNKLYKKGWRAAGHAAICGYGVTKTVWNFRKHRPVTMNIDPRKVFWDRGVEDWDDVTYVCEATVLRKDEFLARSRRRKVPGGKSKPARYKPSVSKKAKFSAYPSWLKRQGDSDRKVSRDAAKDVFEYVVVWEFYDFVSGNYWHLLDGVDEPLLEGSLPYRWVRNPYDIIVFNDNLMDTVGISDIHLIANLQERLNELDTIEMWHTLSTMPITIMNEAGLENPEAAKDAIQNATGPGAVASIGLANGYRTIDDVMSTTPTPSLSPSFDRMRARVERIIEFTLGLPQFMRGGLGNADIATEAALADSGIRTRNGRRIRVMEEWQSSIAQKYVALWAERMDPTEAIPVREPGKKDAELYDYGDFGFDDPETFQKTWWFEYESAPYSPTENHALQQLQKFQQFAQLLFESEFVDNEKAMSKLLELLRMSELKAEEAQAPVAVPGQPGSPGMAGTPGTEPAALSQGNLPPELETQLRAFQAGAAPAPGVSEAPVG